MRENYKDIVALLLQAGANVNTTDDQNRTVMQWGKPILSCPLLFIYDMKRLWEQRVVVAFVSLDRCSVGSAPAEILVR